MIERLILHGGTPKTGTSSLQVMLHLQRDRLARHGLFYPQPNAGSALEWTGHAGEKPKHQWIVGSLIQPTADVFESNLRTSLAGAPPGAHTAIFSTEGIYNHWWDFSAAGRRALQNIAAIYQTELWLWLRPPAEFLKSLYIQFILNPPTSIECYGRDWSCERMLEDAWFLRHFDYCEFVDDVRTLLGRRAIRLFGHNDTTVGDFLSAAGVDWKIEEPRINRTLDALGVEAVRQLNRRALDPPERASALEEILAAAADRAGAGLPFELSRQARDRMQQFGARSVERILKEDGLDLRGP